MDTGTPGCLEEAWGASWVQGANGEEATGGHMQQIRGPGSVCSSRLLL